MFKSALIPMRFLLLACLLMATAATSGCASRGAVVTGKVLLTPVTVARDVVDVPLVTISTLFIYWASQSDPFAPPQPGVGWSWRGGFDFGIYYGIGWLFFSAAAVPVATVDYIVCRSFFPAFPVGLKPWKQKDQSWGQLYFPNTRAMWGSYPPKTNWEDPPPPKDP